MTSIDLWIDQTVSTLKDSGSFDDMIFLKEYQTKPFEVPIKNYLVVVTVASLEKNSLSKLNPGYGNRKDTSSVGFIVYAPASVSGYTLTQRTMELFSSLAEIGAQDSDTPELLMEAVEFDEKADTIRRAITVTFIKYTENTSGGDEGEESYFEVQINNVRIGNIVEIEFSEKREIFNAESYLTDIPSKKIPLSKEYAVSVRKSTSFADSVFYEPAFSAKLVLDGSERYLKNCIVTLVKTHLVDGYLVTDIEFTGETEESRDGETNG